MSFSSTNSKWRRTERAFKSIMRWREKNSMHEDFFFFFVRCRRRRISSWDSLWPLGSLLFEFESPARRGKIGERIHGNFCSFPILPTWSRSPWRKKKLDDHLHLKRWRFTSPPKKMMHFSSSIHSSFGGPWTLFVGIKRSLMRRKPKCKTREWRRSSSLGSLLDVVGRRLGRLFASKPERHSLS